MLVSRNLPPDLPSPRLSTALHRASLGAAKNACGFPCRASACAADCCLGAGRSSVSHAGVFVPDAIFLLQSLAVQTSPKLTLFPPPSDPNSWASWREGEDGRATVGHEPNRPSVLGLARSYDDDDDDDDDDHETSSCLPDSWPVWHLYHEKCGGEPIGLCLVRNSGSPAADSCEHLLVRTRSAGAWTTHKSARGRATSLPPSSEG
ncbi:hypothetical protein CP533_6052 [Ophiocordyceps camponoti-saundersi (nom. inval.)]|nr:hypothetical protein CP533_6052 [Ophiocordyceps camponoti-saundersi (nom. inval.)]